MSLSFFFVVVDEMPLKSFMKGSGLLSPLAQKMPHCCLMPIELLDVVKSYR